MADTRNGIAKVLVVDDEPQIRELLEEFLADQGYTVSVAACGEDALREISRERPDLVFLDLMMPGMSGVETLQRIRERDTGIGVIVVTAVADKKICNGVMELGAHGFITKPIDFDHLETALLMKTVDLASSSAA